MFCHLRYGWFGSAHHDTTHKQHNTNHPKPNHLSRSEEFYFLSTKVKRLCLDYASTAISPTFTTFTGMVKPVQGIHIQRGIERYKGVLDTELKTLLAKANMPYDPYQFADGRVLLVDTVLNFGFLYSTREEVFAKLQLED